MTLTKAERDARHNFLVAAPYCAFCFHPSTTINYLPDHRSLPCCGTCFKLLIKVPKAWDFNQRLHFLQTMTIYNHRLKALSEEDRRLREFATLTWRDT